MVEKNSRIKIYLRVTWLYWLLPFSFVSASPFASTALGSSATTASFSGVDIFKRDSIVQKHQNCFCCNELSATMVDYIITVYDMKIPLGCKSIYHQIEAQIQFSSLCLFTFIETHPLLHLIVSTTFMIFERYWDEKLTSCFI